MKIFSNTTNDEIEDQYKIISDNVKKIRINKKLTQEEVALSMGFTTATFYTNAENYKQGKHFNLEHIIKLSKIFGIEIQDIFKV